MENLKVKQIIIAKQIEQSENLNRFKEIVKKDNIKVKVVDTGKTLKIEKDIYIDILWPNKNKMILENALNNNSIVCKLRYKQFSILFTGDIEELAEKEVVEYYKKYPKRLQANILKVGHHGSKTSTTKEFLSMVNPKIALIGVGNKNKFGHPNEETIDKLTNNNIKIYRTDKMGEISITINSKNKIHINKFINE